MMGLEEEEGIGEEMWRGEKGVCMYCMDRKKGVCCSTIRPGPTLQVERTLANHLVDLLNKSIRACQRTLIELHKWDWGWHTWPSLCTAAMGWAACGHGHSLKLIIHASPLPAPSPHLCLSPQQASLSLFLPPHPLSPSFVITTHF